MKILAAISFGLAVAVSGLLMVLPTYSGWSSESPLFPYGPDRRCMPMIVRRIPSTDAVRFLDYFATLNSAEAAALLDALARGHAMQFFPPSAVHRDATRSVRASTDP